VDKTALGNAKDLLKTPVLKGQERPIETAISWVIVAVAEQLGRMATAFGGSHARKT